MATGISISSTSNLSTGQKIVVANAREAFEPDAPDPDLIGGERIPVGVKQWDVQTYARLAAADELTEGTDYSVVQQLVTATVTITPSEHGIIVTLSKRLIRRQGDANVVSLAGSQMGGSLRRQQAINVIALYDTISKTSPGATNAIDITHLRGAVAYLLTDNDTGYGPAKPPIVAALHIEQISDIMQDITDPGTAAGNRPAGFGNDMLARWWKGSDRLYGVQIFHSGNITRDSGNDAKGAVFAPSFAHMVMANEADPTEEDDNSARVIEFGLFQEWGEAEIADPHGVEIFSDAVSTL
jgi:hypothetical protein